MNTGIFWSVLLTKIRGVTKIHIYFFKAWSMRTFVNVHTGVASGTSLIYMYDASKQSTKKKYRCLELTASNKQTVLPLSRIVPCCNTSD